MKRFNFEEWCHSIGDDDPRIVATDMVSMTVLKECWDYLSEQNKETEAQLARAEESMTKSLNECIRERIKVPKAFNYLMDYFSHEQELRESKDLEGK